jgi:nitrite reductase/ring-hydroxylating ferredoxin subunit
MLESWDGDHALPGGPYRDPEVYETEIRRIFLRSWLYVGHQSQVPGRGDYFLFEIAGESVIVIRNAEGGINAMMNVCRHRGSRICDQPTGGWCAATTAGPTGSTAGSVRQVTCRRASTGRSWGCGVCTHGYSWGSSS